MVKKLETFLTAKGGMHGEFGLSQTTGDRH